MHRLPFRLGQIYLNKKGNNKYRVVKNRQLNDCEFEVEEQEVIVGGVHHNVHL